MKLVIVESPTKSKTIGNYLGSDFKVEASVGHIRDLAIKGKGGFGVDVEDNFKATYEVNKDKKKVIKGLQKLVAKAKEVYVATDPDREGEAIAWHLAEVLNLPIDTTKRLSFHEITKDAIKQSLENPGTINMNLVNSQETRRIIDRILGFKLSGLLQQRIGSKSAGRVQSVVLKMICDREQEINDFVPEEYWTIECYIIIDGKEYLLTLTTVNGEKVKPATEIEAEKIIKQIGDTCEVIKIDVKDRKTSSKEPYRTSTLQQDAYSKLGFRTAETSYIAQQLYEGIETNGELTGLITYMRTDSTRISPEFVSKTKDYIISKYGKEYYKGEREAKKVKNAQDAHECIRPTSIDRNPESIKSSLTKKQYDLYKLIYERTLASLMSDKIDEVTTLSLVSNNVGFSLKGVVNKFPGYNIFKMDEEEEDERSLPKVNLHDVFKFTKKDKSQHFTKPPARYTEAKLVKMMEEKGIGRPSTYAVTINTLVQREYIVSTKGVITPTYQGTLTSNVLSKYFPDLMSTEYTANLETSLDEIEKGDLSELEVLTDFYFDFDKHFEEVRQMMWKEPAKKTGELCPNCGGELIYRRGKFGEFIACNNYPNCTYVKKEQVEVKYADKDCPKCGKPLVYRKNKKGEQFIGCSNYPKCKYIEGSNNNMPKEVKPCPSCGAPLVVKKSRGKSFLGCTNYPNCKHTEPLKKN